jgi:hypothetical protein
MNKKLTLTMTIDEDEFQKQREWLYRFADRPEAEGLINLCDVIHDAMEPIDEGLPFTVILRYPEKLTDHPETYTTYVSAGDYKEAIAIARREAAEDNNNLIAADGFGVVAVFSGQLEDLNFSW